MEGISFREKEESFTTGTIMRSIGLLIVILLVTVSVALPNTSPTDTPGDGKKEGNSRPTGATNPDADSLVNVQGQMCDNDPPYWYEHYPFAGSVDVSHFTRNLKFKLRDDVSGVDLSTLHLNIDGIDVYENSEGLVLSGDPKYYIVTYQFPAEHRLMWGDTVWVKISVCDLWKPANCMEDSVYFVVESDDAAPVITPEYPVDMDTDVPVNSSIRFQISDEKSGIDFNTLEASLNGNPIQTELTSGDVYQAHFTFNSREDSLFGFNETQEMQITVKDSAQNPATLTYSFTTVQEEYPPLIEFIYPPKNSDQVILGTDSFIFEITDLHSGVDFDNTDFFIEINNSTNVEFDVLTTEPVTPNGMRYTIKPTEALHHNDVGKLVVNTHDNAGNPARDTTTFKVLQDFDPPVISLLAPTSEIDVSPNHEIRLQLEDAISGVDLSTVAINVNGQEITDYTVEGDAASYVLYFPYTSPWNTSVNIDVAAADIAENDTAATFEYQIVKDNEPPTITLIAPQETSNIEPQHQITLEIADAISGVNDDSIVVTVNQDTITDYQISGDASQYLINFDYAAEWNGTVNLAVKAVDFAGLGITKKFNYQIKADRNKPSITLVNPLDQSEVDHPRQDVILEIADDLSGINSSTIKIVVNQQEIDDYTISGNPLKYTCSFEYTAPWDSVVSIAVQASDFARNSASANFQYTTPHPGEIQIDLIAPATSVDVPPQHEIKFSVSGSRAGIDQEKIKLMIDEQPLTGLDFEGDPSEIIGSILYFSPWNSTVSLTIIAEDFAGQVASKSFDYAILKDATGPTITRELPTKLYGLDPVVEMKYRIQDDVSGVNPAAVILKIDDEEIPVQVVPEDGAFTFTHLDTFLYNDSADILVSAEDNAGNPSRLPERYIFQEDEVPPVVTAISPLPGDTAVALDTSIVFSAYDDLAGIDVSSLLLNVKDNSIPQADVSHEVVDDTVVFTYKPEQPFLLEDSVWVQIGIKDNARNPAIAEDLEYSFTTIEDHDTPVITIVAPDSNATEIERDAPIVFEISDALTGINESSLLLNVNDQVVTPELSELDSGGYQAIFTPSPVFDFNDTVTVDIYVEDNSKNRNTSRLAYEYYIVRDDTPPAFSELLPAINATNVPCRTPFHLAISDSQSGVDSSRFKIWIDDLLVPRKQMVIQGDSANYTVDFQPLTTFEPGDVVAVKLVAYDFIGNENTLEYVFTIDPTVDETAPVITPLKPAENDTNVAINAIFSISAQDESGIDIGTALFNLKWNGRDSTFAMPDSIHQFDGGRGVQFFYNISTDTVFQYNAGEVAASFSVSDLACDPNHGEKLYSFVIENDYTRPEIFLLKPENIAAVLPNTLLKFEVGDNETGLQIDQIKLEVNNQTVSHEILSLSDNWYTLTYNDKQDTLFEYGAQIPVRITAVNRVGLDSVLTFTMQIVEDQTNPIIVFENPVESRPPRNSEIVFKLLDAESGINLAKTNLSINQTQTGLVEIIGIDLNGTDQYSVETINDKYAYRVRFNPDSLLIFDYFQEVTITISTENFTEIDEYKTASLKKEFKVVHGDTIPPWIANMVPAAGATDVPPMTEISFDVLDSTGVNTHSLSLFNLSLATPVAVSLAESTEIKTDTYSGYHIAVLPDSNQIGFNDTIQVKIGAADFEQNVMDTLEYQFYSQRDEAGPQIVAHAPQGEKVELKPHFLINISDSLSGVDTVTVAFAWRKTGETDYNYIEKKLYETGVTGINPDSLFEYSFLLEDNLEYDTHYDFYAKATDNEGNAGSHTWQVKTRKFDEEPPWIEYVDPVPENELQFSRSEFVFKLGDDKSYVVKEKIEVDIRADTGGPDGAQGLREWHFFYGDGNMEITEENDYLMIKLTRPADDPFHFFYNDKVEMNVFAVDAYNNPGIFNPEFYTKKDDEAPYLVKSEPQDKSTNNPLDTKIYLKLADDLAGVLVSTIRVKILDRSIFEAEPDSVAWENAPLLYPNVNGLMQQTIPGSGMKAAANVTLEMPAGSMNFDYNRMIWLFIQAEDDLERSPNILKQVISFGSEERLTDLAIMANFPRRKYSVGDSVKIAATVSNKYAAVVDIFDVTFAFEDENIQDTLMVQPVFNAPKGQDFEGILPLNAQGKFRIAVTVDKQNAVMEQDESNNIKYLDIEVVGGKLEVKSNPFTPNGDGINDDAYFNCEQFKLEDPMIKIFDLRGRFIKQLTHNDLVGKKFRWNGRDKNGNEVMPGVFLFILQDKGNAIKNGCVVVAR